jgi:hypothetical protein
MPMYESAWLLSSLALGITFKVAGYHALLANDCDRYRYAHTLWHVSFPLGFGIHTLVLWYLRLEDCSEGL